LHVPKESVGRWVNCPHCGMGLAALADAPTPSVDAFGPDYDLESIPSTSRLPLVLLGGVGVLFLVGMVVALVVSARHSAPAHKPAVAVQPRQTFPVRESDPFAELELKQTSLIGAAFGWLCILGLCGMAYALSVVLILIWVVRDARSRAIDSGALWVIVILLTGWLGLVIYIASRPAGTLVPCRHCNNRRLEYAKLCPHCGNS
jgi:hypothetical protein